MTVPWMVDALCAQTDPDLFFPDDDWQTARAAKRVCASCPVRADCLDYAVRNVVPHGVWGGLSERERRRLRRAS